MKLKRLLRCPLCGTEASITRLPHPNGVTTYNVSCGVADDDSDSCSLVLFGGVETQSEMVTKWNRRAKGGG